MNQYLFLVRSVLNPQAMENVQLLVEKAVKDTENNPMFTEDKPWEVRIDNGYPNVIYDPEEKTYKCFYTLIIEDKDSWMVSREERASRNYNPRPDRVTGFAYAESKDGIHWEKPNLHRVSWNGNSDNNLLFKYAHGTGVMLDLHETDPGRRYKMVTKIDYPIEEQHMAVSYSPNGIDWEKPTPWPKYNPPADSHNLPFWNEKENCYMLLSRIWRDGVRITTISRSDDFLNWSKPQECIRGQGFENQIYAMPAFKWGNCYIGLASMFHEGDRDAENFDTVDLELTYAEDPLKFDFVAVGQHVIDRGNGKYPDGEFDCGCIYASPAVFSPDGDMWIYYMGGNGQHTNFRESSLGRAKWKKDKFAALTPRKNEKDSVIATSRMCVLGNTLELLADHMEGVADADLEVEVAPNWSEPAIEGFSFSDSKVTENGDKLKIEFTGHSLEELKDQKVVFKIRFKGYKLWAINGDIKAAEHRLFEGLI